MKLYYLSIVLVLAAMAISFHVGATYAAKKVSRKWTSYIMEHCVRLDMLKTRITDEFHKGEMIAEGKPVVMTQDTLLRIINEVLELQNR